MNHGSLLRVVQHISCRSLEAALEGDDVTNRRVASPSGGGGGGGTLSHLIAKATMLAVCVGAVTSFTCITDARVDVIISLPHLLALRTFHRFFSTDKIY